MTEWIVIKVGGTSVANPQSWGKIKQTLSQYRDQKKYILLVCSAPSRMSNLLTQSLE